MDTNRLQHLEELIDTALRDHLIDACEREDEQVVIIQGSLRFVLSPARAFAFLRGVVQGMGHWHSRAPSLHRVADPPAAPASGPVHEDVPDGKELVEAFRKYLLHRWQQRYEAAGSPLSASVDGLTLWIRYGTGTTAN